MHRCVEAAQRAFNCAVARRCGRMRVAMVHRATIDCVVTPHTARLRAPCADRKRSAHGARN
eukprot:9864294-Lingulodinium_polyedra.AAC.1